MLRDLPAILPTPTSRDWKGRNQRGDATCLPGALLPTPTSQAAKHGETPDRTANAHGHNLWDIPYLLPTPAVNDMGRGKTVEEWDAWTAKMQQAHGNGNGHGKSLEIEAARLGATMAPPLPDGPASSDDPHQHQLSLDEQDSHD
jgi:DNA (cytosine-5)-methyltransferase 1